jgi:hypothetical protein
MDRWGHGIGGCGQDRAGFYPATVWVLPAIPYPCESEQFSFIDLEAMRLLGFARPHPLV